MHGENSEASVNARDNYFAALAESRQKAQLILHEAQMRVAKLGAEEKMEKLFQQGLRVYRITAEAHYFPIQFRGKPAQCSIEDVHSGGSFEKRDNIRFIVYDTDPKETYLADISLERRSNSDWVAHEVDDVHLDSGRGGHGSRHTAVLASSLTDRDGGMHGSLGLSDRLMEVISSIETVHKALLPEED